MEFCASTFLKGCNRTRISLIRRLSLLFRCWGCFVHVSCCAAAAEILPTSLSLLGAPTHKGKHISRHSTHCQKLLSSLVRAWKIIYYHSNLKNTNHTELMYILPVFPKKSYWPNSFMVNVNEVWKAFCCSEDGMRVQTSILLNSNLVSYVWSEIWTE